MNKHHSIFLSALIMHTLHRHDCVLHHKVRSIALDVGLGPTVKVDAVIKMSVSRHIKTAMYLLNGRKQTVFLYSKKVQETSRKIIGQ